MMAISGVSSPCKIEMTRMLNRVYLFGTGTAISTTRGFLLPPTPISLVGPMLTMKFEELVAQWKKRHVALTGMWKPYQAIFSLCSAGLWTYHFYKNSGEFTLTLLGLAALTLFLAYYATAI